MYNISIGNLSNNYWRLKNSLPSAEENKCNNRQNADEDYNPFGSTELQYVDVQIISFTNFSYNQKVNN